jgi:drug/metabolite transporter (DMT)-like permease
LRQNDSQGLLLALAGFAVMTVGDTVIKTIAGAWPGTAVALTRYSIGAAGLALLLARREGRSGFRIARPKWQLVRGFGIGVATTTFFSSLFLMPLADATTIGFTSPVLTTLLAAALLGERLRWTAILALLLAFAGTVVVLRPSFAALGPAALLPLASAAGMSLLMIGNRKVAGTGSTLAMQFAVAAAALPVMLVATLAGHLSGIPQLHVGPPDWTVIARCALVAVSATCGHALIYLATERTGAARVAPMTYVQLIMALALGWAVFGDRPDAVALMGAAVIIAAGLLLWWSGRVSEPPRPE